MTQASLFDNARQPFDLATGQRLRDEGIERAAAQCPTLLDEAREIARNIARRNGTVTAEDVCRVLGERKHKAMGNGFAAIFKSREFEWTGKWVQCERIAARSRFNRVWRLK